MLKSIQPVNYQEYPECMFAMVAAYLEPIEGVFLRKASGNICFRHDDEKGNTYKNGLLHSFDDKPAVINGTRQEWYRDGKRHRDEDKPAIINSDGNIQMWYRNGKRHRDGDKPAIIELLNDDVLPSEEWYKNGELHRDGDNPAVIRKNCTHFQWWKNGMLHRENDLPAFVDETLSIWSKNGRRHRDGDLPAYTDTFLQIWYKNGEIHRGIGSTDSCEQCDAQEYEQKCAQECEQAYAVPVEESKLKPALIASTYQEFYIKGKRIRTEQLVHNQPDWDEYDSYE